MAELSGRGTLSRVLVTGGTGLIGSNVCLRLVEDRVPVRALVRPGSDADELAAIGVELVRGDVTDKASLVAAAEGCDAVIHSAALLGGAGQDLRAQERTNRDGAFNVLDAGEAVGARVVALGSTPYLDHRRTLTEESPVAETWADDPYTVTKGAAYVEAKRRWAERGADIVAVIPGATFGPGLVQSRALGPTSFNRTLRAGINGRIDTYLSYPAPWVLAADVAAACVAAASVGVAGRTYLAFGAEDAQSTASWLNVGCEVAGVAHRVADLVLDANRPVEQGVVDRFGATQVALARRSFPEPWFDASRTRRELRIRPRALRDAMVETVEWLRSLH